MAAKWLVKYRIGGFVRWGEYDAPARNSYEGTKEIHAQLEASNPGLTVLAVKHQKA